MHTTVRSHSNISSSGADDDYVSDLNQLLADANESSISSRSSGFSSLGETIGTMSVKRSVSLNSGRSGVRRSIVRSKRMSEVGDNSDASGEEVTLPASIVTQLEHQMLLGNLKRDSFRSRNGTNNFVLNPLFFDERMEVVNDGDLDENTAGVRSNDRSDSNVCREDDKVMSGGNEESLRLNVPCKSVCTELVYANLEDLRNLRHLGDGRTSKASVKRSRSLRLHDLKSLW